MLGVARFSEVSMKSRFYKFNVLASRGKTKYDLLKIQLVGFFARIEPDIYAGKQIMTFLIGADRLVRRGFRTSGTYYVETKKHEK